MGKVARLGLMAAVVALSGCKIFGGKAAPEGLNDVKSVGKAGDEWKDSRGGIWRLDDKKLDWKHADKNCHGMAEATKKRWRLPSPDELMSAREEGITSPAKNKSFGWIELAGTWSAEWETSVDEDIAGVYVDMNDGKKVTTLYDDQEHTTLCIRTDGQGNTWADGKGHQWWYVDVRMEFEAAQSTCEELAKRRHEAWRLPAQDELVDAIKAGIQGPENKAFGRDYLTLTWSGQVAPVLDADQAFAVDLRNGRTHLTDVDEDLAVVCVAPGNGTPATASTGH